MWNCGLLLILRKTTNYPVKISRSDVFLRTDPTNKNFSTVGQAIFHSQSVEVISGRLCSYCANDPLDQSLHLAICINQFIDLLNRMDHGRMMLAAELPGNFRIALLG